MNGTGGNLAWLRISSYNRSGFLEYSSCNVTVYVVRFLYVDNVFPSATIRQLKTSSSPVLGMILVGCCTWP